MTVYFNSQLLPGAPAPEYVTWIDVMGIQSAMSRSLHISANFVFKMHAAALQAPHGTVRLYPVMDGMYATSPDQTAMLDFLRSVLEQVADEFVNEQEPLHRFVVKGALAFGPIIHGAHIPAVAANVFQNNLGHKDSIVLGLPIVQAHQHENLAPPFGIYVHESARSFAPAGIPPLKHVWWRWSRNANDPLWSNTRTAVAAHYEWCASRPETLLYAIERINAHKDLAARYFQ